MRSDRPNKFQANLQTSFEVKTKSAKLVHLFIDANPFLRFLIDLFILIPVNDLFFSYHSHGEPHFRSSCAGKRIKYIWKKSRHFHHPPRCFTLFGHHLFDYFECNEFTNQIKSHLIWLDSMTDSTRSMHSNLLSPSSDHRVAGNSLNFVLPGQIGWTHRHIGTPIERMKQY